MIYHNYDAGAVGPVKGPSNVLFKKERPCSIKTVSPKKLQTVSVLSQSSRLVSLQSKTTERPTTSPCSHHVETERVEEFTPFCAVASSFAHTILLLGAFTSLLGDVAQKTRTRQTTHTIRAQEHWDGFCRGTQTAVALWSCYDTCVLRLTRVRAQPQASKSVSRVYIVFHITAHALFWSLPPTTDLF